MTEKTDNNRHIPDELEQLLKPRCGFGASPGLKDRILKAARQQNKSALHRYLPWAAAAAAACVAAVVIFTLQHDTSLRQPEPAAVVTPALTAKADTTASVQPASGTVHAAAPQPAGTDLVAKSVSISTAESSEIAANASPELEVLAEELPTVMAFVESSFDQSLDAVNIQFIFAGDSELVPDGLSEAEIFEASISSAFADLKNFNITIGL